MNPDRDDEETDIEDAIPPLPAPGPYVPYTGTDLVLVVLLLLFTWTTSAYTLLATGLYGAIVPDGSYLSVIQEPKKHDQVKETLGQLAGPAAANIAEPTFFKTQAIRLEMWARALVFPLQLILLAMLTVWRIPIPPSVYGVTLAGWRRALVLALLAWVVLTPVVLALNWGVSTLYSQWMDKPLEEHALVLLTHGDLMTIEWVFWIGLAVLVAPVLEEFFFRGLLQAYVLAGLWRGYGVLVLSLVIVFMANGMEISAAQDLPGWRKLDAYMPILFLILLGIGFLAAMEYAPGTKLPGMIAVSMFFAAIHSTWPHPVALFVLSMGLCYLREWSGSILAPILVHGLFNGTSSALYFLFPG